MTEEEITAGLLSRLPLYGEFEFTFEEPKNFVADGKEVEIRTIEQKAAGVLQAMSKFKKEEQAMQTLLHEGFVINRHDIKIDGKRYMQLTEKGRELKGIGALSSFYARQHAIEQQQARLDKLQEGSYFVNKCIAFATGIAALYYLTQLWDWFWKHH